MLKWNYFLPFPRSNGGQLRKGLSSLLKLKNKLLVTVPLIKDTTSAVFYLLSLGSDLPSQIFFSSFPVISEAMSAT